MGEHMLYLETPQRSTCTVLHTSQIDQRRSRYEQ